MAGTKGSGAWGRFVQVLFPGMNRNIALLLASLAFSQSTLVMLIATATLAANSITGQQSLAFWPTSFQFLGLLIFSVPGAYLMKWAGRRWGLSLGSLVGVLAALGSVWAIYQQSFVGLCIAGFCFGFHAVCVNQVRFAAIEAAEPGKQANAVSYVLIGGLIAAVAGPTVATWTQGLLDPLFFAGVYLAIAGLMLIALIILQFTDIPKPEEKATDGPGRSIFQLLAVPRFSIAILAAALGYGVMNFMMVPTPLAMKFCGFTPGDSNTVIMLHVLGMFAPSLFTGRLINRFGIEPIIMVGGACLLGAALIALSGVAYLQFVSSLVLLGLGWNFCFIGGTTMLASVYKSQERAKAQALNDFCVFGLVAFTSFSAGQVLEAFGWSTIAMIVIPSGLIIAVFVGGLWLFKSRPEA